MKNYLVIKNNIVENIIVWDGESEYDPGEGYELVEQVGNEGIGWNRSDNGDFSPPPEPLVPALITYCLVDIKTKKVIDFKKIQQTNNNFNFLPGFDSSNALVKCDNEDVQIGWKFIDGEFIEPA